MSKRAATDWGKKVDHNVSVPMLIPHEVDEPLTLSAVALIWPQPTG